MIIDHIRWASVNISSKTEKYDCTSYDALVSIDGDSCRVTDDRKSLVFGRPRVRSITPFEMVVDAMWFEIRYNDVDSVVEKTGDVTINCVFEDRRR